jgi:hypothetical protein
MLFFECELSETAIFRRSVEVLLEKGSTPAEAAREAGEAAEACLWARRRPTVAVFRVGCTGTADPPPDEEARPAAA